MRDYFADLLINEVVAISGAKLETLKKWYVYKFLPPPKIIGKHRRFSAEDTARAVLAVALSEGGLSGREACSLADAAPLAEQALQFLDEHCAIKDNTIVQGAPYIVYLMTGRAPTEKDGYDKITITGRAETGEEKCFFEIFDRCHTGVLVNIGRIMADALMRAVNIRKGTDDQAS